MVCNMENLKSVIKDMGMNDKIDNTLEKEYNKALKNEEFKEFVSKINVPKSVLEKYTSLLEESCTSYNHCKNCKNIMECQNKIKGYAYLPKIVNDKLTFYYRACKHQEKIIDINKYKSNITLYQTQANILDANVKSIYSKDAKRLDTIEWLTNFLKNYPDNKKGLYLHGSFGSGKSYLITAILVELAKKDVKSTIIFWPEFLSELKSYFGDDIGYKRIMYQIKNTPILFIDDIGAENLTVWSRDEVLCTILQYRMDNNLKTFFSSNLSIDDLEKHLSITKDGNEVVKARRIIERIKQMTDDIELISKNLRSN